MAAARRHQGLHSADPSNEQNSIVLLQHTSNCIICPNTLTHKPHCLVDNHEHKSSSNATVQY